MTATITLPQPRIAPDSIDTTALRVAGDAPWVAAVVAVGAAGSAGIAAAAVWATVTHPAGAAASVGALTVWAFAVATVREIRESRRAPKGLGAWRIACGATPLNLTLPAHH